MNAFVLNYTAHCKSCNTNSRFSRSLLAKNNDIINPDFEKFYQYIDEAEELECPICLASGNFEILNFEFEGKKFKNPNLPNVVYILRAEKVDGIIKCWNDEGMHSKASIADAFTFIWLHLKSLKVIEQEVNQEYCSFMIKVEIYFVPAKHKIIMENDGFSINELKYIVKDFHNKFVS